MKTKPESTGLANTAQEAGSSESRAGRELFPERYFGTGMSFGSKDGEKGRQSYKVTKLPGRAEILGVYPVKADEPCHLVEMVVSAAKEGFDMGDFTQALEDRAVSFWQVPWMEVLLSPDGTKVVAQANHIDKDSKLLRGDVRIAFFFHYLNTNSPFLTPFGDLTIPAPAKRPARLKMLKYEAPD